MTTFTATQEESLVELEDRVINCAKSLLNDGYGVSEVVAYLDAETVLTPGLGAQRFECAGPRCANTTDTPVRETTAVFWLGDHAATYCSTDCLNNAAEDYAERALERAWSA